MRRTFRTADDRVWFTADLHFGHEAMIRHCYRPWANVDEMDKALIENWNARVGERDHIFFLGDFSFRSNAQTLGILAELKGIKYLIRGNHDRRFNKAIDAMWDGGIADYHEIEVDDQPIVMCHFALRSWNRMHYGSWNLHGHSHGNLPPQGKQLDVGVDAVAAALGQQDSNSYIPLTYHWLRIGLTAAQIAVVDHHVPKEEA